MVSFRYCIVKKPKRNLLLHISRRTTWFLLSLVPSSLHFILPHVLIIFSFIHFWLSYPSFSILFVDSLLSLLLVFTKILEVKQNLDWCTFKPPYKYIICPFHCWVLDLSLERSIPGGCQQLTACCVTPYTLKFDLFNSHWDPRLTIVLKFIFLSYLLAATSSPPGFGVGMLRCMVFFLSADKKYCNWT